MLMVFALHAQSSFPRSCTHRRQPASRLQHTCDERDIRRSAMTTQSSEAERRGNLREGERQEVQL
jgi:hypothetical protein